MRLCDDQLCVIAVNMINIHIALLTYPTVAVTCPVLKGFRCKMYKKKFDFIIT